MVVEDYKTVLTTPQSPSNKMFKFAALALLVACVAAQAPPPPPFLQSAPAAKQQEFAKLIDDSVGLTDDALDKKVNDWVSQQDGSIKKAFADFQAQVAKDEAAGEKAHAEAISHFSPAAKAADAKLTAISNNKALTVQQKGEQIDALLKGLPNNVREEIETAMSG